MKTMLKEKTPDAATSDVKNMEIGSPSDSIIHHSESKINTNSKKSFSNSVTKLCFELDNLREAVLRGESPEGFYKTIGSAISMITALHAARDVLLENLETKNESIEAYVGRIEQLKQELSAQSEGKYLLYLTNEEITCFSVAVNFVLSHCGVPLLVAENLTTLITYLENLRGDKK